MKVVIIKYDGGNIQSVLFALNRLGIDAEVTDDHTKIINSDKVIFPGVGHAASAMKNIKESGLDRLIPTLVQPVLGICLGMQIMCHSSEEGDVNCLGIFSERVRKFNSQNDKVPQMGWNQIGKLKGPLFEGVKEDSFVYFVHSYYAELGDNSVAVTDYIAPYSSALQRDNFYATQFHPEKSSDIGSKILENFIKL